MNKILVTAALMLWLQFSCSATPGQDNTCTKSCGNATIAGSESSIMAVTPNANLTCTSTDSAIKAVTIEMAFFFSQNQAPSTDATAANRAAVPAKLPLGGVAFYPLITGSYDKINTPKTDWCTDSCGLAKVSFNAICPTSVQVNSDVTVQLLSGAAGTIDSTVTTGSGKVSLKSATQIVP